MGNAPGNGASITNLHVADMPHSLNQQGQFLLHQRRMFHLSLPYRSANGEISIFWLNILQFCQMIDIYNICWPRQAHVEQRDEALTSGQHFRILSILTEKSKCLI